MWVCQRVSMSQPAIACGRGKDILPMKCATAPESAIAEDARLGLHRPSKKEKPSARRPLPDSEPIGVPYLQANWAFERRRQRNPCKPASSARAVMPETIEAGSGIAEVPMVTVPLKPVTLVF